MNILGMTFAEVYKLADEDPGKLFELCPELAFGIRPAWVANNHIEYVFEHHPDWLMSHWPKWMLQNKLDWVVKHRLYWLWLNHPDLIPTNIIGIKKIIRLNC